MAEERTAPGARLAVGKLPADLLAASLARLATARGLLVGPAPGRDVAVVEDGARCWILTADPITFATERIARYAVTVNANDVATAGATPRFFLATVLLPRGSTAEGAQALLAELDAECARVGVALVGGHTEITDAVSRPVVSGAMVGEVARERLVRSDGARVGDVVLCTKGVPLEGAAILARERAEALRRAGVADEIVAACAAYLDRPGLSVVADARVACDAARVHAMHDPTEGGLATALRELAEASGVGLRVDAAALPVLAPARVLCRALAIDPLGLIASGALLVAVAEEDAAVVAEALRARSISCAAVARVVPAEQGVRLVRDGREEPFPRFARDEIARVL